jgi:glycosyltransferase involved in cell wall biosynthesis
MISNTYLPHVGGVAHSIHRFAREFRRRGHDVLVVAPEFDGESDDEEKVLRVPAFRDVARTGFSISLAVPPSVKDAVEDFDPELIHSHHPYLLGIAALRLATAHSVPLIFTHHTLYEKYAGHKDGYPLLMRMAKELSVRYARLCDHVIVPSESVAEIVQDRGISTPVTVIPTGVNVEEFERGEGEAARRRHEIPSDAPLIGYAGRLAPEKNLEFLARSVSRTLREHPRAWFVVVGDGPFRDPLRQTLMPARVLDRVRFTGFLRGEDLADAFAAMDVFAFASKTETQGLVLVEAMAAGTPVVALRAPGVREVLRDGENGLVPEAETEEAFAEALGAVLDRGEAEYRRLVEGARRSAAAFSVDESADRALELYDRVLAGYESPATEPGMIEKMTERLESEWNLFQMHLGAAADALFA